MIDEAEYDIDSHLAFTRLFLDGTRYSSSDILSISYFTRTVLTRNGGRYRLTAKGKVIRLDGPSANPSERI